MWKGAPGSLHRGLLCLLFFVLFLFLLLAFLLLRAFLLLLRLLGPLLDLLLPRLVRRKIPCDGHVAAICHHGDKLLIRRLLPLQLPHRHSQRVLVVVVQRVVTLAGVRQRHRVTVVRPHMHVLPPARGEGFGGQHLGLHIPTGRDTHRLWRVDRTLRVAVPQVTQLPHLYPMRLYVCTRLPSPSTLYICMYICMCVYIPVYHPTTITTTSANYTTGNEPL
ncbi:hypothetical protein ECC02_001442 [Trypanosoma cruzi]|uniref:Uncharacterized protein n=1 Tax=Trypanosoma cruzi TaxID=5693 RepID=A0A7J6YHT9_TRYCR|nr:hypothetical protein ECC02_001442 [Trypanosoma cruzi]